MDHEDRLLGLLTSENLSEFIMLRQIGQPSWPAPAAR